MAHPAKHNITSLVFLLTRIEMHNDKLGAPNWPQLLSMELIGKSDNLIA